MTSFGMMNCAVLGMIACASVHAVHRALLSNCKGALDEGPRMLSSAGTYKEDWQRVISATSCPNVPQSLGT